MQAWADERFSFLVVVLVVAMLCSSTAHMPNWVQAVRVVVGGRITVPCEGQLLLLTPPFDGLIPEPIVLGNMRSCPGLVDQNGNQVSCWFCCVADVFSYRPCLVVLFEIVDLQQNRSMWLFVRVSRAIKV